MPYFIRRLEVCELLLCVFVGLQLPTASLLLRFLSFSLASKPFVFCKREEAKDSTFLWLFYSDSVCIRITSFFLGGTNARLRLVLPII